MKTISRLLWLLSLCVYLSACTTYRTATLPGTPPDPIPGEEIPVVSKGDAVKIHLHSGEKESGKVLWVTDREIALGHRENYGGDDLVVPVSNIESIEVREQSDGQIEGAWFASLLVAAFVGMYYSLRNIGYN